MSLENVLCVTTTPATEYCTGSVIFLHGSGGNGLMTKEELEFHLKENLSFPHLKVCYPTAPLRPFSLRMGLPRNVWFDRLSLHLNSPEHLESIDSMAATFDKLIENEIKGGIPPNRIILGFQLKLYFRINISKAFHYCETFQNQEKMPFKNALRVTTIPATKHCTGSVIFLHGSGGNGLMTKHDLEFYLKENLSFPHLKVCYPTAPLRPYTLNMGLPQNVWFDRLSLHSNSPEHLESIDKMASSFDKLIENEINDGIPPNRIILGGFSMGGSFSLHYGYRHRRDLRGIFCLSSFLSEESKVYQELKTSTGPLAPLFMACGVKDDVIEFDWAENTDKRLKNCSVETTFHRYENLYHEMCKEELILLKEWILKLLPPL